VYKIGNHSIEADYVVKHYKEDNVIVNVDSRITRQGVHAAPRKPLERHVRTAVHYIK